MSNRPLANLYGRSLRWTLARPMIGIALSLLLPLSGFLAATQLELQFFPPADRDPMQIEVELPVSASLATTEAVTEEIRDRLCCCVRLSRGHPFLHRLNCGFMGLI